MTFYDVLTQLALSHLKIEGGGFTDGIQFDLRNKSVRTKKKYLMKNGKIIPQTIRTCEFEIELTEDMPLIDIDGDYEKLEEMYRLYKYSIPNEYNDYVSSNFEALDVNKLTLKQMSVGMKRQIARIQIEAYVLLAKFEWKNEKHHYWQSKVDDDLIIYKEWMW